MENSYRALKKKENMENIVEVLKYNENNLIWKVYFYILILKGGFESPNKNIINKNFYKKTTIFFFSFVLKKQNKLS